MSWIDDLSNYYSRLDKDGNKVLSAPQIKIKMLYLKYRDNTDAVLERATSLYIDDNNFFPSVTDFKPYVEMASYAKRSLQ